MPDRLTDAQVYAREEWRKGRYGLTAPEVHAYEAGLLALSREEAGGKQIPVERRVRCGCDEGRIEAGPAGATYSVMHDRCDGTGWLMRTERPACRTCRGTGVYSEPVEGVSVELESGCPDCASPVASREATCACGDRTREGVAHRSHECLHIGWQPPLEKASEDA